MNTYRVWLFPVMSADIQARSLEEAEEIAARMNPEDFNEHTDMSEMNIEETADE